MIIDCLGGSHPYGLDERRLLASFGVLVLAAVPATVGYALWRIFVTNQTGPIGTTILGLDENSATYKEVYDHGSSWRTLFLYGLTGVVFAFEVFRYLVDLLSAWVRSN